MNIRKRWNEHRRQLNCGKHHSAHLQSAWKKYGESAFTFVVLEACTRDQLHDREQFYLDTMRPWDRAVGYNIGMFAHAAARGRKLSEETRKRMSEAGRKRPPPSEEARKKNALAQLSRPPISEETRRKIGLATRNRSEETRQKLRDAALKQPPASAEKRRKVSEASRNRSPISDETRRRMAEARRRLGPLSEEVKQKISFTKREKQAQQAPHKVR